MRTPTFTLSQDDEFVIAAVHVPHIKVSEIDFCIDECQVSLSAKPYFLRLTMPHALAEDGRQRASFDHESGTLTLHLPKAEPRLHFPDLDLLTLLLPAARRNPDAVPMLEVLNSSAAAERPPSPSTELDLDWHQQLPGAPAAAPAPSIRIAPVAYGFNRAYTGVFAPYADELSDFLDTPAPESLALADVRAARLQAEEERFDADHYLADFVDDEGSVAALLRFKPHWIGAYEAHKQAASDAASAIDFTDDEKRALLALPNREHLILPGHDKVLLLGLVDLLFGYAYDVRTTLGDATVESGWTICKLSAQLSWLDELRTLDDVWRSAMRRALTYPLYRNWSLAAKVWKDVKVILKLGRRAILRAVLSIRHTLERSDQRRLLARVFMDDYCVWVQRVDDEQLRALTRDILPVEPQKAGLFECIDLTEVEAYAAQHEQLEALD
jgi:protein SHQ1